MRGVEGKGQGSCRSSSRYLPGWRGLGGDLGDHPRTLPRPSGVLSPRNGPMTRVRAVRAAALRVASLSPESWRSVFHVRGPGEGTSMLWSRRALVGTQQVPLLSPGLPVGLMAPRSDACLSPHAGCAVGCCESRFGIPLAAPICCPDVGSWQLRQSLAKGRNAPRSEGEKHRCILLR